ncbi:MAG: hypothetical protein AB8F95_02885 [Bacteroidia bacterium]
MPKKLTFLILVCVLITGTLTIAFQSEPVRRVPLKIGKVASDDPYGHASILLLMACDTTDLTQQWEAVLAKRSIVADFSVFEIKVHLNSDPDTEDYAIRLTAIDSAQHISASIKLMIKYSLLFEQPIDGGGYMLVCKNTKSCSPGFDDQDLLFCQGKEGKTDFEEIIIQDSSLFFWEDIP